MKKLIFIVLTAFTFLSCSKDDVVENPIPMPSIVDDWSIEKYGYMDDSNAIETEYNWDSDCTNNKDHILFTITNNFTANYFTSACEDPFFAQENGSFSLNTANKRITISGGTDWDGSYTILKLTNTNLVLKRVQTSGVTYKLPSTNFYKFLRRN